MYAASVIIESAAVLVLVLVSALLVEGELVVELGSGLVVTSEVDVDDTMLVSLPLDTGRPPDVGEAVKISLTEVICELACIKSVCVVVVFPNVTVATVEVAGTTVSPGIITPPVVNEKFGDCVDDQSQGQV